MRRLLLPFYFFFSLSLSGQTRFRVVTWNVENMFDCEDDTLTQDEEFLPEGVRGWTWGRYWRKVTDIGRVVMGIGETEPPALVALCEVENERVMQDIAKRGGLWSLGYDYVMTDGPDARGIDVALMFQPALFCLLGHESRRVPSVAHGLRPTRDLLHAWGKVPSGDTLHVVVCHLPSRVGDHRSAQINRRLAVETLMQLTDSLLTADPHACMLVMGDFNATLRDKVFKPLTSSLVPLTPDRRRPSSGSYRFRGNWSWIDHILVSQALLEHVGAGEWQTRLYTQPWMQRPSSDGNWYPRRTYLGTIYNGGVSDHVPVYFDFSW